LRVKFSGVVELAIISQKAQAVLQDRFGRDCVIALATAQNGAPQVRYVNAFYDRGAFYVLTYALSGKMRQIEKDNRVAVAGDWFTANGRGENMGFFGKKENSAIAEKMKEVFSSWIGNGHADLTDENTCILRIALTDGVLLSHGTRYEIDFTL